MVVVSPHLDDAVFSCGHIMARHPGCTVLTVFAGVPDPASALPDWDARCGFTSAQQAVLARRQEDEKALSILGAHPVWLEFLDSQYGPAVTVEALADALHDALGHTDAHTVLVPLGLFHSDHLLVHEAAQRVMAMAPTSGPQRSWRLYEEVPYRGKPEWVPRRLETVCEQGMALTLEVVPAEQPGGLKFRAAQCYASQWHALGPTLWKELDMPERFWTVHTRSGPSTTAMKGNEVPHGL